MGQKMCPWHRKKPREVFAMNITKTFRTDDPVLKWTGFGVAVVFMAVVGGVLSTIVKGIGHPTAWLLLAGSAFYIAPTVIAFGRQHRDRKAIAALDIAGGWTLVGWVVALLWSMTVDTKETCSLAS
jgi:Superinfection immunity protein